MPSSMSLWKELAPIDIGYAYFAIPKFHGKKEEFTGWLAKVERVLACCILSDQKKFKVVISRLRGCALQWWNNYKFGRRKKGKEKVRTWKKLSSKLKGSFCPSTYTPMKESISIKPTGSFPSTPQKRPTPQMIFPPQLKRCLKCRGLGHLAIDCPNIKVITLEERKAEREEENQEEKKMQLVEEPKENQEEDEKRADEGEKPLLERVSSKFQTNEDELKETLEEILVETNKGDMLTLNTHHPPRSHEHLSLPTLLMNHKPFHLFHPHLKHSTKISVNPFQNRY